MILTGGERNGSRNGLGLRGSTPLIPGDARFGIEAEVTEGLSENDTVILYPSSAIADGLSVAPRSGAAP